MTELEKWRDELLEQENMAEELKLEYERRLNAMFEKELVGMQKRELTRVQRLAFTFFGLMGLGFFVFFGYLGLFNATGMPWLARGGFLAGSLFGLVLGTLFLRSAIQGYYHRKRLPNIYTGGIWGIVVIQITIAMMLAGNMAQRPYQGTIMLLSSLAFLVMGVAFVLKNVVEQSTLKLQEEILRMRVQMAELSERLEKK